MKKSLFYLSFLTSLACVNIAKAQNNCSDQFWGSESLYTFTQPEYTPTPAEYTPIFINYIGRNGASHMLKDVTTSFVYSILMKADSAHSLKVDGNKLRKMLLLIQSIERPKLDNLSLSGIDELKGIGTRMRVNYRDVFKPGSCVKVSALKQNRMTQSAEALLAGLGRSLDNPACDKPDYNDDDNLQPLGAAPGLKEFATTGDWKDNVDNIRDAKRPENFNVRFLTRFFEQKFFDSIDETVQNKFIADMYDLSLVTNSIKREITQAGYTWAQLDIRSFFTCEELELFDKLNSAAEFYKSGPGNDKAGIQVRSAVPLLVNFINTTDAYSVGQTVAADVRFTTSGSIASLAALMNIKGANKESADIYKFDKVWKASEVIPLAANIQWILYKGTTPDTRRYYVIKFMMNEKEVAIDGLKTNAFPYYQWDDVKAYFLKKLNDEWDVEKLSDNMHNYLLNLK
ncbi:histidine phosphatase family protein [Mucilaginibacter sp. HMF5004]|uniref:histidine-type phosphatase n=1 Tax=Mucilaginibacter rivuli TaxID=2857527 RepID=UPI001C5EF6EF|nr:histidine-type phosphatase [Mucilaginibacter rivuli]MBW4888218.1 histidine phosphatase family protein [Mucilaginibacter rivuli]